MGLNTPKTNPRNADTAISGRTIGSAVNLVQITVSIVSRKSRQLANVMAVPMVEIILVSVGVRRRFFESLASDNMSEDKKFLSMERTMKKAPGSRISKRTTPRSCKDCELFQPRWKYRSCYYVRCPYKIKGCTIRDTPLFSDPFHPREVSLNGI